MPFRPDVAKQDERLILVPDVLKALQDLAAHHRKVWGGTVLQITGTNGKTTTKELISSVLSEGKQVLFTEGNLNNHIGVPLTLLRIKPEHDIAVIETGANHPGEIADLCRIVCADFGLITNVGRAHLEGFGSFEGVKRTKGELYDDLHKRGKKLFLNAFDTDLLQMAQERGFVLWEDALPYVEGRVSEVAPFVEMQWRAEDDAPWHTVRTNLIGAYNIANLRAAVTIGLYFGIAPEQIDHALETYNPTNSRSELREVGSNHLVVDAYNANPSSMSAALTNFSFFDGEHKMVILGDMRELGEESLEEHKRIVKQLQGMELERIWLVGEEFSKAAEEGMRVFKDVEEVKKRYPVYGLSNWNMETFRIAYERYAILQAIEQRVVSGDVKMAKPDNRIFKYFLKKFELQAEKCLFIDDNLQNVMAARHNGMKAICFKDASQLRALLLEN